MNSQELISKPKNVIDFLEDQNGLNLITIKKELDKRYRGYLSKSYHDSSAQETIFESLFEDCQALYYYDKTIEYEFDMPTPLEWSVTSVKLRAFIDRNLQLYHDSLAPFEKLLKKYYENIIAQEESSNQAYYEKFISLYREEYFKYQKSTKHSSYFLYIDKNDVDVNYVDDKSLNNLSNDFTYSMLNKNATIDNITLLKPIRLNEKYGGLKST